MNTISKLRLAGALCVGTLTGMACRYSEVLDHCANADGDDYCAEKYPDATRPFCARGNEECEDRYPGEARDGCVEQRPEDDACYSPCGGGVSLPDDPDCDSLAEGSSTDDASDSLTAGSTEPTGEPTTGPTGPTSETESATESNSTTASGCVDSSECGDAASPICVEMACAPCSDDAECEAKDPSAPACRDDGQCVACTAANASGCGDTTPVCDDANNACVGCAFHEQCAGTACDIATGACFTDDCVVTVDGDGGADYEDIGEAAMDGCVVIVHELDGATSYQEAVSLDGITVALLAADGEEPMIVGLAGNPSLAVTGGATTYVQGLAFRGNQMAVGITANASSLYLDRTQVVGNTGGGVVLSAGADGHLRNCFVGGFSDVVAMTVDESSADILYTTLGGQFDAPALACADPTSVTVRNSILVSRAVTTDIDCDDADISYSATEFLEPGTGNVALGDMNMVDATAWFGGYNNGNFFLNNPPPEVLTAAQWQAGDPIVDIGGEPRPTQDGAEDAAGADVP